MIISKIQLALIAPVMTTALGSAIALAEPAPSPSFTVAHESSEPDSDAEQHSPSHSMDMAPHEHHHESMEIPDGVPVPSVDLIIHPDAVQGWNLEVQVTNFTFAPERVNASTLPTEGHAHLFINGEKITRLYGNWYYLNPLPPGTYDVSVVLNANTHEELVHNGQVIQDVEILQVPPSP